MKFDVVIGNPPYQEGNGSGNGGGGTSIYNKFVLASYNLSSRYVTMITPARWYTDESKVRDVKELLLNCNQIMELHDFTKTEDIFKGVYIMGGICYYIIDKEYTGDCLVVEHNSTITKSVRPIKENCFDIFIRNAKAVNILKKVINNNNFKYFYDYINDYNVFGLRSYERGSIIDDDTNNIKLYYTGNDVKGGGEGWISDSDVIKCKGLINKHKVYINSVSDNMLKFPYTTLYKGFYGEPNSVCTESYLVIGPLNSKDIANNIIKYLQTRFVKILVQQRKTSQLAYKRVYKFVPLQDFTSNSDIDWSQPLSNIDQQLYKKYNLSEDEINYIEQTIKPLDNSYSTYPKQLKITKEDLEAAYINTQLQN